VNGAAHSCDIIDTARSATTPRTTLASPTGTTWDHDELQRATTPESDRGEVANVSRCNTRHVEFLRECYHAGIDEAQSEVGIESIDFHRPRKLRVRRRRIEECTSSDVVDQRTHGSTLVSQEIIELGEHQSGNVTSPGGIDCAPERDVVGRRGDQIVEESSGIAEKSSAHSALETAKKLALGTTLSLAIFDDTCRAWLGVTPKLLDCAAKLSTNEF